MVRRFDFPAALAYGWVSCIRAAGLTAVKRLLGHSELGLPGARLARMRHHPLLLDELAVGYSLNEEVARARYESIDGSAIGQIVLYPEAAGIGPMTLDGWDHE